jgi:hypothetical protein
MSSRRSGAWYSVRLTDEGDFLARFCPFEPEELRTMVEGDSS